MKNPSAFPLPNHPPTWAGGEGMTLRDYFAAKAMQGTLAGLLAYGHDIMCNYIAEDAYKQADAMMKAREE